MFFQFFSGPTGVATQTLIPTGIASGETFGTTTVTRGVVTLTGVGNIASGEAFGSPTIVRGLVNITGAGNIATAEAFGTSTLLRGAISVTNVGNIATAEAFGSPTLLTGIVNVTAVGNIASAEAFGTLTLARGNVNLTSAGAIATAEAFGTHVINKLNTLVLTSIASAEAFGTVILSSSGTLTVSGIASLEAFGATTLLAGIQNAGAIASAEAFGALLTTRTRLYPALGLYPSDDIYPETEGDNFISPGGITTGEGFGSASLTNLSKILPGGIASVEALGNPSLARALRPVAISSAEAFGTLTVNRYLAGIGAIPTGEAIGNATISKIGFVSPTGVPSAESIPQPVVVIGGGAAQMIIPAGIISQEAIGVLTIGPYTSPPNSFLRQLVVVFDDDNYGTILATNEPFLLVDESTNTLIVVDANSLISFADEKYALDMTEPQPDTLVVDESKAISELDPNP